MGAELPAMTEDERSGPSDDPSGDGRTDRGVEHGDEQGHSAPTDDGIEDSNHHRKREVQLPTRRVRSAGVGENAERVVVGVE
jgi:hypothetical protein